MSHVTPDAGTLQAATRLGQSTQTRRRWGFETPTYEQQDLDGEPWVNTRIASFGGSGSLSVRRMVRVSGQNDTLFQGFGLASWSGSGVVKIVGGNSGADSKFSRFKTTRLWSCRSLSPSLSKSPALLVSASGFSPRFPGRYTILKLYLDRNSDQWAWRRFSYFVLKKRVRCSIEPLSRTKTIFASNFPGSVTARTTCSSSESHFERTAQAAR